MATREPNPGTPDRPTSVGFDSLTAARAFRDRYPDALADRDRGNEKTVRLRPDADRNVRREAERAALRSGADEHLKTSANPSILTDAEKDRLKARGGFSWQDHAFEAAKAKSRAEAAGVADWLDLYEPDEGAGGVLDRVERQKQMEARTGAPTALTGDRFEEETSGMQEGRKAVRSHGQREERAREAARDGVEDAIQELIDVFGYEPEDARALAEPEPEPEPTPETDEPVVSANVSEPEPTPTPTPEPTPTPDEPASEPATGADGLEGSTARALGEEIGRAAGDAAREIGRGARTVGAALRFAATGT